jgi:hypothetical protein
MIVRCSYLLALYGLTRDEIAIIEEAASGGGAGETGMRNRDDEHVASAADGD